MQNVISHSGRYFHVREDYLEICDRNVCAAQILDLLEYWTSCRFVEISRIEKYNAGVEASYKKAVPDIWLRESLSNFVDGLLGSFGEKSVRAALKLLKTKGYITERSSNFLSRLKEFKLNIGRIQETLDKWRQASVINKTAEKPLCNDADESERQKSRYDTAELPDNNGKNATTLYITKNQKTNSLFSNAQDESDSTVTSTSHKVVESVPNNASNSVKEEFFIEKQNSLLESNVAPSGFASLPHNASRLKSQSSPRGYSPVADFAAEPPTTLAPETVHVHAVLRSKVSPSEKTRQLDSPPGETEIFEAEVVEESSGLVRSAGENKTSPEVARIIQAYENSGVIPSPIELKQWANEVIGDTVSHYRKSGRILYTAPNDVDYGFITYLAKRLKNQENTAGASAWIRAMEKDPGRWQELSECVTQWRKEQFLRSEEGKVAKRVYNKASGSILSDYEDLGIFD